MVVMRLTGYSLALALFLPLASLADWRGDFDADCAGFLRVSASPAAAVGLWYHFLMNESNATTVVTDSSANANNATSTRNTALMSDTGKIGKGFKFNGSSDNIKHPSFPNATQARTFSAWIKTTTSSEQYLITDQQSSAVTLEISASGYPNKITMLAYDGGFKRCASSTSVQDGTWRHVAGTYNNNTQIQIYVNGIIENSLAIGNCSPGTNIIVGSHPAPVVLFNGTMDDVRIYNRVLSSNEIFNLWNAGNGTEADQ